ncbi:hypothetical protein OH799_25940 [Nocardia sp. NBC_00881]|uniref:hypothetical protein n=1 Tax=Nocardia sp. NBC_00881 TaxID=2975995 RepID=UPI0038685933|nr:hypothetical protein OH799_25940 [Nocardia sp. NBC_00881]
MGNSTLGSDEKLSPGESLRSGDYTLTFHENGELVLYSADGGVEKTWTPELPPGCDLSNAELHQANGALYATNGDGHRIATYTAPATDVCWPGLTLELTEDGRLVGRDPMSNDPVGTSFELDSTSEIEFPLYHPRGESTGLQRLIDTIERGIDALADTLRAGHPEQAPDVRDMLAETGFYDSRNRSVMSDVYSDMMHELDGVKSTLQSYDEYAGSTADQTAEYVSSGMNYLSARVGDLNEKLKAAPYQVIDEPIDPGMTVPAVTVRSEVITNESELMDALYNALDEVERKVDEVASIMEDLGNGLDENSPDYQSNQLPAGPDPSADYSPPSEPGTETGWTDTDNSDLFSDLLGTETDDRSGLSGPLGSSGLDMTRLLNAITGQSAGSGGGTPTAAPAATDSGSVLGMMMPMMMVPMMASMTQAMQKRQQDAEYAERERERERREQEAQYQQQQPVSGQPTGATPAVTAPVPAGGAPTIGTTGMVDAELPNGTTQKVTATTAEALQKAINNPNGSDARAAYAGTLGESTPAHSWTVVDAADLRTGDVVQWENRTAVAIVTQDGLFFITSGQMVPLDTNNPFEDGQGDYGTFQGFFHPTGVDTSTATTDPTQLTPPAMPTRQPPAAAIPPSVAAA